MTKEDGEITPAGGVASVSDTWAWCALCSCRRP